MHLSYVYQIDRKISESDLTMNQQKKVLVLGATGAMGQYLVPYLSQMGYAVDAVSLDKVETDLPDVRYIQADVSDIPTLTRLLANRYDGVVDFMIYQTAKLPEYLPLFLNGITDHYIYLSSYRVYDNKELPVRETSPRLLDTADDIILRNSDDYSIYKARGENIVRTFPKERWTMIRPAITYSRMRYQLVTLEAPNTVGRARAGKAVLLPEEAKDVQGTMSWAGDVAMMIARLLFNDRARGEVFTVSTAEHHTWGEIADYYKDICGLKAIWIPKEEFFRVWGIDCGSRWQLECDRLFPRIMDNSKVLDVTGMKQEDLRPLFDGLKYEISRCPEDMVWPNLQAMDDYIAAKGL